MEPAVPIIVVIDAVGDTARTVQSLSVRTEVRSAAGFLGVSGVLRFDEIPCAMIAAAWDREQLDAIRERFPRAALLLLCDPSNPMMRAQLDQACSVGAMVALIPLNIDAAEGFVKHAVKLETDQKMDLRAIIDEAGRHLSTREHEIMLDTAYGLSQKEIGEKRGVGLSTVKTYVKRILRKRNVDSLNMILRPILRAMFRDPDAR